MGRELVVAWLGRHRRDEWESLCGRYRRRVEPLRQIRDLPVLAKAGGPEPVRQRAEGEALLAALPEPSWTIALDRRGKAVSSKQLARKLAKLNEEWPHAVCFLVGSDLGLSEEVLVASRERLSFGPITLPHELARLVLYEQLYRALSILGGIKYHREPL
ncbi:MAG: 23S rRNA (pseudouridine(1915)-N(3))-methyltransferase RlmH [Thermoanaerobaculia bacterium]|nr:23S rRNA (pseudouridine(1915)-N(3))-methyltransferase RlmH [Thermoanaerobaculia bacterium]